MNITELPAVIAVYQRAHDQHDNDAAIAAFSSDATVIDEGVTYSGTERIRSFLDRAASEYTYTRTLTGVEDLGNGAHVVHNHLSGNFPGGEVDLRFRFQLVKGLIHRLEIAP